MVSNPFSKGLAVQVSGDASGANSAIQSVMGNLTSMKGLAIGTGAAIAAAIGVKSVNAAREFQAAMQESLAIMGDVSDAMRSDMEAAARDVATTTTFSAEQAAESYFFLASAGLEAKESIEALPTVAEFAQAGMFDMARATDLLTDSASALGLAVEDYNRLADVLVKANTLANASVEQFATALKRRAAAEMRNANVELEEGVAVLAAFADQGIKAERAGQVFQRTLLVLQEAENKNAEAVEELGLEIFDASGEMNSMIDIMEQLSDATEDMSTKERNAALESLGFTRRTREGIVALLGKSDAMREYRGELEDAGGTTEEVADKQLETFNAQVNLLKSELNDVAISIGQALLPVLTDLVGGLISVTNAVQDMGAAAVDAFDKATQAAREWRDENDVTAESWKGVVEQAKDAEEASLEYGSAVDGLGETVPDALERVQLELQRTGDAAQGAGDDAEEGMDRANDAAQTFLETLEEVRKGAVSGLSVSGVEQMVEDRLPDLMEQAGQPGGLTGQRAELAMALQEAKDLLEAGELERLTDLPRDVATVIAGEITSRQREENRFRQSIFDRLQGEGMFGEQPGAAFRGADPTQFRQDVSVETRVDNRVEVEIVGDMRSFIEVIDTRVIESKERRVDRNGMLTSSTGV